MGQAAQFILGCLFWVGFAFFLMARRRARIAAWESDRESERRLDEAVRQWKAQHPDKDSGDAALDD